MSHSTTEETPAALSGGLPASHRSGASITIVDRVDGRVTVSTWETCAGVAAFVAMFLGEPAARAHTSAQAETPQGGGAV